MLWSFTVILMSCKAIVDIQRVKGVVTSGCIAIYIEEYFQKCAHYGKGYRNLDYIIIHNRIFKYSNSKCFLRPFRDLMQVKKVVQIFICRNCSQDKDDMHIFEYLSSVRNKTRVTTCPRDNLKFI